MFYFKNKQFDKLKDRQLMELILINQINIFQLLDRANHFALSKFSGDLAEKGIHKDEAYLKLLDNADGFLQQYAQLKDDGKI